MGEYASALRGCGTGDAPGFVRNYWEVQYFGSDWELHQTTPKGIDQFDGMSEMILWEKESGRLAVLAESVRHMNHAAQNWRRGKPNWGKKGVIVSQMGNFPASIYTGAIYDPNCCAIVPSDPNDIDALWAYCHSGAFTSEVKNLNQNRKVEVRTFLAVPFDRDYWSQKAEQLYSRGLPKPYSNNPTQWIFHGHPCGSVTWDEEGKWALSGEHRKDEVVLHVAVARLLGYRWPAELDAEMELADAQREWASRCGELLPFADEDGIVCIPPVRGESGAADRLRELLKVAYGEAWSASTERELLSASTTKGRSPSSFDQWLREHFFEQHCKLFQNRPFIWHIWDGRKDGFHALVNYHKLAGPNGEGRRTLEALTFSYLGEWIDRQRSDQQHEVEGSDARLAAALSLQSELEKILEGAPPYDLFIRWKPLHEQPLGWNPDINDGVRLNIRPFILAQDLGRKNAGLLRNVVDKAWTNAKKPGVKDRGKEVEPIRPRDEFPWFWGCDPEKLSEHRVDFGAPLPKSVPAGRKFDGQRWNNLHYSRAAREAARAAHKDKG